MGKYNRARVCYSILKCCGFYVVLCVDSIFLGCSPLTSYVTYRTVLKMIQISNLNLLQIDSIQFFRGPGGGALNGAGFVFKTAISENELAEDGGFVNTEVKTRKEFPETWIWDDLNEEGLVLKFYLAYFLNFLMVFEAVAFQRLIIISYLV